MSSIACKVVQLSGQCLHAGVVKLCSVTLRLESNEVPKRVDTERRPRRPSPSFRTQLMPAAAGSEFLAPTPTACSKDCRATQKAQAAGKARLGWHIPSSPESLGTAVCAIAPSACSKDCSASQQPEDAVNNLLHASTHVHQIADAELI